MSIVVCCSCTAVLSVETLSYASTRRSFDGPFLLSAEKSSKRPIVSPSYIRTPYVHSQCMLCLVSKALEGKWRLLATAQGPTDPSLRPKGPKVEDEGLERPRRHRLSIGSGSVVRSRSGVPTARNLSTISRTQDGLCWQYNVTNFGSQKPAYRCFCGGGDLDAFGREKMPRDAYR